MIYVAVAQELNQPRKDLFQIANHIIEPKIQSLRTLDDTSLIEILLYGHKSLNPSQNKSLLSATIEYIRNTERFS